MYKNMYGKKSHRTWNSFLRMEIQFNQFVDVEHEIYGILCIKCFNLCIIIFVFIFLNCTLVIDQKHDSRSITSQNSPPSMCELRCATCVNNNNNNDNLELKKHLQHIAC